MEFDRRVQIWVDQLEGRTGFASGYLVAPRLVLTAAHVLDRVDPNTDSPVTVTLPDTSDQEFPTVVRWQRKDDYVDAALIEIANGRAWPIPQSLGDLLTRPPQRYGLIIGSRPHPVTSIGFPRMQKETTDGRRLDEQFTGHIAPGTGALAGRYELIGSDPIPVAATATRDRTRWSGMSGAAVLTEDGFGGDLLCGVIRRDRRADGGGTRLTATPAARLLADEDFRTLITEQTGWHPVLEAVEPASLLAPAAIDRNLRSPAALLRATTEAVAFHGRDSELASLQAWCESGTPAIQLRVLTGPGGQGKTRLARRLTEMLGWRGWATGHLAPHLTDTPTLTTSLPDFTALTTSLPLLLVVDYAETRPRLLRHLITHLHRSRHRVRVLLLARSDGQWRTQSLQTLTAVEDLLEEAEVIPLAPLIPTSRPTRVRRDAFCRAARDLARLLPLFPVLPAYDWASLAAALPAPADLHDHRYDNILTLHMAALIALLQHGPRPVDTPAGTPPERTLLKHEERFWEASAKTPAYELDLPTSTLGVVVAVAALCGAGTRDEALKVLTPLPGLPTHQTATAAEWLASLYPPDGDRFWGSLQPDRIAEYLVSYAVVNSDIPLAELVSRAAPGQQAQLIIVLARAATAHFNADRATDSTDVLNALDTALTAVSLDYHAVKTAAAALPYPSRITAPLSLRLTSALTQVQRQLAADSSAYEPALAVTLNNYGTWLAEMGRHPEALAATYEAVEICHRLAADDLATRGLALGASLLNLGAHLAVLGHHSLALASSRDAVKVYRRLAADYPDRGTILASALINLGTQLSTLGQHSEALAVVYEAVKIYRHLVTDISIAHEPVLATALNNLSNRLASAGRNSEALITSYEAMAICRRITAGNRSAHESSLAMTLAGLGSHLSTAGRHLEALAVTQDAVNIRRRLAAENPVACEPQFAIVLTNLAVRLAGAGQAGEALAVAERAVGILRRLVKSSSGVHESDLASALSNLSNHYSSVARHREALAAAEEAVSAGRRLVADNPDAYTPGLAGSLSNLGIRMAAVGRHLDALAATEEAVDIRRRLVADSPAAHTPDLATSLSNLCLSLMAVGRHPEALATANEAVTTYRQLVAEDPAAHKPGLAIALTDLGKALGETGLPWEALEVTEEAVDIRRQLVAKNPAAHEPDLALTLSNLGPWLGGLGRHSEALVATMQAIDIRRRLVAANPAAHKPSLAYSLHNSSSLLGRMKRYPEALAAIEEAVYIRRRLIAEMQAAYEPDLATSLCTLGSLQAATGRYPEALTATGEAVEIYRRLAAGIPAVYETTLAEVLSARAAMLIMHRDYSKALRATGEAVSIYKMLAVSSPSTTQGLHDVLSLQAELLDILGREWEARQVRRWLAENQ
ncbi:tetratricopeptide repeat protein [Streptomyces sp. NPDC087263]|uniref:tetratricopeptide repeat protein n=1 Tax=Streptomyces sp. NPDC087263 TaxID=3365773 RepID=UPI0038240909